MLFEVVLGTRRRFSLMSRSCRRSGALCPGLSWFIILRSISVPLTFPKDILHSTVPNFFQLLGIIMVLQIHSSQIQYYPVISEFKSVLEVLHSLGCDSTGVSPFPISIWPPDTLSAIANWKHVEYLLLYQAVPGLDRIDHAFCFLIFSIVVGKVFVAVNSD